MTSARCEAFVIVVNNATMNLLAGLKDQTRVNADRIAERYTFMLLVIYSYDTNTITCNNIKLLGRSTWERRSPYKMLMNFIDHPRSGVVRYIISVVSVCLSVCQTITFESLDDGKFIFVYLVYLPREYGSNSYIRLRSREQEKRRKALFPQCKLKTILLYDRQ